MTSSAHPIYDHPPVALVVAEIKFPGEIGSAVPAPMSRALADVLGEDWVIEQVHQPSLAVTVGGSQSLAGAASTFPASAILRFATRNRSSAVALTVGSVTVETVRYGTWAQFRSILEIVTQAVEKLLRPAGIVRVGVRYVNEVRIDGHPNPDWADWLSPTMLPPVVSTLEWVPLNWAGLAQYQIGEKRYLVLRYGPQTSGFIVNPDGPLRRPDPRPQGPFFLLDFDAYWEPSAVPRWDSDVVLDTCDQLHDPVQVLFDKIVTDRLVADVFHRKEHGDG